MLFKAINFAAKAHKNHFRKGTTIPYIVHPINVMKTLARITDDQNLLIAAVLHDTIEDTDVTEKDIQEYFGEDVLYLVKKASESAKLENSNENTDWKSRKEKTIAHIKEEKDERVMLLVCADKLDNVTDILFDYQMIGEKIWERFNSSKEAQLWYYLTLAETMKSRENDFNKKFKQISTQFFKQAQKLKL